MSVRTMCAVVFLLFTFLWFYLFQADVLALLQHVMSHGQTHYNRTVGAVLVTLLLWMLQLAVYRLTLLRGYAHALTFFPSMLCIAVMSDVELTPDVHMPWGMWVVVGPLLLLLWGGGVWAACQMRGMANAANRPVLFSRHAWVNLLQLAAMMVFVVSMANTNAVVHYRAHAETSLAEGRLDDALAVGKRSLETDPSLTMLRVYALSRTGQLGERLFQYAVSGTGNDLLPLAGSQSRLVLFPADSIYRHLGAVPKGPLSTADYLKLLEKKGKATAAVGDYRLCGLLIDRDLDAFASHLADYYPSVDSLPRHYREALVLYNHLRSNPCVVYQDAAMEADYADLQELERQYPLLSERKVRVEEKYAGSYWFYYNYLR